MSKRPGWAQTPEQKEKARKTEKYEMFERYKPLQAGFELRRDYSEPLDDNELGDVQGVYTRWQEALAGVPEPEMRRNLRAVDRVEADFPNMTGEMMSYLTDANIKNPEETNPESTKAFLDYHYLLGRYQQEINEEDYFESEKEKWARKKTSAGGPGTYASRLAQTRGRFAGVMAMFGGYEGINVSSDDEE